MFRRITPSWIILFMLISGTTNKTFERTGLLGKSVTLPSGVNEPGTLTLIQWSIFNNQTYIADFFGDKPEYYRGPLENRLRLNVTTGELEIMDLRKKDTLTYTVYVRSKKGGPLDNKVILTVHEGLPEPNIIVINNTDHDLCRILLKCSLKSDRMVKITWALPPSCIFRQLPNATMGQEAEAWCSPTQDVNITCNASNNVSTTASTVTTRCLEKKNISAITQVVHCSPGWYIMCFIFGVITTLVCFFIYKNRDALSDFAGRLWEILRDQLPCLTSKPGSETLPGEGQLPCLTSKSGSETLHGEEKGTKNDNSKGVLEKESGNTKANRITDIAFNESEDEK